MHFHFDTFNYLWNDMMDYKVHYEHLYNALHINALSEVLPKNLTDSKLWTVE